MQLKNILIRKKQKVKIMNKKEAIEEIENAIPDFILNDFQRGKETGLTYALDIVKQLDEPEKTVVPKCVASCSD